MVENGFSRSLNMASGIMAGGKLEQRARKLHAMEKERIYESASQIRGHLVYQNDSDYLIFKVLNNLLVMHSDCAGTCQECELIDKYIVGQPLPDWYTRSLEGEEIEW